MESSSLKVKIDMAMRLKLGFVLKMKLPTLGVGVSRPDKNVKILTTKSQAEIDIADGPFTVDLLVEVPNPEPAGQLLADVVRTEKPVIPLRACGLEGGATVINKIVEGFCYTVTSTPFLLSSYFFVQMTLNDPKEAGSTSKSNFDLTSKDFQIVSIKDTVDFNFSFSIKLNYGWDYSISVPTLSADLKDSVSLFFFDRTNLLSER